MSITQRISTVWHWSAEHVNAIMIGLGVVIIQRTVDSLSEAAGWIVTGVVLLVAGIVGTLIDRGEGR